MGKLAISVEGLWKRYQIGGTAPYKTLRESVTSALDPKRWFRVGSTGCGFRGAPAATTNSFWAIRDVSFEVAPGEVVGIVGRNGAGKSTLLKVLSRITSPSKGAVELQGRVASLLEVGTGFHPELSGRENIFLNGAVLGMRRTEIARQFDAIVDFAEVETFLDTPVKRYSSGMYMRLAFAVAAHLEPEILIVDEVLAVGDASFQKKCLGKMGDVAKDGRTVLFVSHNMAAITRLCNRCVMLEAGSVVADGPASKVISNYLRSGLGTTASRQWDDPATAPGNAVARLRAVRVRSGEDGGISEAVDIRCSVNVEMEFDVLEPGRVLVPNLHFFNGEGILAFIAIDQDPQWRRRPRSVGRYVSTVQIPGNFLAEGTIVVTAALSTFDPVEVYFQELEAVAFEVVDSVNGDAARGDYAGKLPGVVRPMFAWATSHFPTIFALTENDHGAKGKNPSEDGGDTGRGYQVAGHSSEMGL